MAQPGEFFPQQFALGVLNLFNSVKQKNAELQEMRRERAARNLIEQQRLDMSNIINQRNVGLQEKQLESEEAEREAERQFRYKTFEEARKAAAQDAITKFGAGQPAFFPLGAPIPPAPTVKGPDGKEIPAFEYTDHPIPGLGTFVLPRNKVTDTLGIAKLYQDLNNTKIEQIADLMRAERDAAHAEHYRQEVARMKAWKVDPQSLQIAQRFDTAMRRQLGDYVSTVWASLEPKQKADLGNDPVKAWEKTVDESTLRTWKGVRSLMDAQFSGAAAPSAPSGPGFYKKFISGPSTATSPLPSAPTAITGNHPLAIAASAEQNSLLSDALKYLKQEEAAESSYTNPLTSGLPPGQTTITRRVSSEYAKAKYDYAAEEGATGSLLRERTIYDEKGNEIRSELTSYGNIVGTLKPKGTAPKLKLPEEEPPVIKAATPPPPTPSFKASAFSGPEPDYYNDLTEEENARIREYKKIREAKGFFSPEMIQDLQQLLEKAGAVK